MLTFTECEASYKYSMNTLKQLPNTHFNQGITETLKLNPIGQDRASYIRNAARIVFGPSLISHTCNIHILRKFKDSSVKLVKNRENESKIQRLLSTIIQGPTLSFVKIMVDICLKFVACVLNEPEWAKSFRKIYVNDGWMC